MDTTPSQRLAWIDTAKGLGIVIVVMGHMADHTTLPHAMAFKWFGLLFSMPLFFMLSGYTYKPRPTKELFVGRIRSLLVPYAFYLAVIFSFLNLRGLITGAESIRELVGNIVRAAFGGQLLVAHLGVFWFVTCLFITQLSYHFLRTYVHNERLLAGVIAFFGLVGMLVATYLPWVKLPLAANIAPMALVFYAFGHFLKVTTYSRRDLGLLAAWVLLVCLGAGLAGVPFALDMKLLTFAPVLLIMPLAFSLCWMVFELCKLISFKPNFVSNGLIALGGASLVIMFLHQFIHFEMRSMQVGSDLLILAMCLLLPYAIYKLAQRYTLSQKLLLGTGWKK